MSLKETFNRLIGKEPSPVSRREAISPQEAWRRAIIRSGNLDWQGLPIDRNPGRPIAARPEQSGYRELVSDFLERAGMRIECWNERVQQMIPGRLFDQEAGIAERAHERRFDVRNRDDSMQDYLRDGAVARGPKRRES
jgi:hypothetical protein